MPQKISFQGFYYPEENYFRMPNIWTDITANMNSLAELKVVEYVLRHTWGYKEFGRLKKITLDEFEHGRKRADGSRIDQGIGMRKQAIISGLRQAVKDGYLMEEVDQSDKGRIKKFYGLRMLEANEGESEQMYENHTPDVRFSYPSDMKIIHRSEKDTIEKHSKKDTVSNGIEILKEMKDLEEPEEKAQYVTDFILSELGDEHSRAFYRLVAAKVPEEIIRHALSEIKADGARSPAKVFTTRIATYALEQRRRNLVKSF
jgi:predicted transcriptional regulator